MKLDPTDTPNLKRHPVSKVYYYVRGRTEMSLKTRDLERAKLLKAIREDEREGLGLGAFKYTVGDLYPSYLAERRRELEGRAESKHTIRQGTFDEIVWAFERHLLPFFKKAKLAQVTPKLWVTYCHRSKVSDLANHRKVFKGFLDWCKIVGHLKAAPDITYLPKHTRRPRRIITDEELVAIFTHARGSLRLFLAIALYNGLRRKEVMTLSWDGIDLEDAYLTVYSENNKLRRGRTLPINETVITLLRERLEEQRGLRTSWVFPNAANAGKPASVSGLKTAWRVCLKRACLTDITWNDFRATYEKWAHKSTAHTDTQREKFSDASIDVQKKIYVSMDHKDLRGLEAVVKVKGLDHIIKGRATGKSAVKNV